MQELWNTIKKLQQCSGAQKVKMTTSKSYKIPMVFFSEIKKKKKIKNSYGIKGKTILSKKTKAKGITLPNLKRKQTKNYEDTVIKTI